MDWNKCKVGGQYSVNKSVRFETSMLRSDLYDYSDAYIAVKGRISGTGIDNANRRNKKLSRIVLHLDHACPKSIANL